MDGENKQAPWAKGEDVQAGLAEVASEYPGLVGRRQAALKGEVPGLVEDGGSTESQVQED